MKTRKLRSAWFQRLRRGWNQESNKEPLTDRQYLHNFNPNRPAFTRRQGSNVVRRAKQGASCQVKDLMFQNLASRNYRVLQLC